MAKTAEGPILLSFVACGLIPLFVTNMYYISILVIALISAIATLGFRLLLLTGHLSLGQAVFMGVGAYVSVHLVGDFGFSFWLAMPLAGVVSALFGYVVGRPALRLKGAYFAVLTLGLSEAFQILLLNYWSFSGGPSGIPGGETSITVIPAPESFLGLDFSSYTTYYYLVLVVLGLVVLVFRRIDTSSTGRMLSAIEQSDDLARSVGVNITRYKASALILSSFVTGISGALLAFFLHSVTPGDFDFWNSANIVFFGLIGGVGHVLGPVFGALGMTWVSSAVGSFANYETVVYGIVAIVIIYLLPGGLVSIPAVIWKHVRKVGLVWKKTKRRSGKT